MNGDKVSGKQDHPYARFKKFSFDRLVRPSDPFRARHSKRDISGSLDFIDRTGSRSAHQWIAEQRLLWASFAFASGIALYMLLPEEPDFYAISALFFLSFIFVLRAHRHSTLASIAVMAFAALSGIFFADLRTALVEEPRLAEARTLTVSGWVTNRDVTQRGPRLTIDVKDVGGAPVDMAKKGYPHRIRVSVPKLTSARIGDAVTVRARLFPPSGPVRPGGYEFSFRAYFEGIGATGFAYGEPKPADLGTPPLFLKSKRALADLRLRISDRVAALLGRSDSAALASTLLVGDRSGLSPENEEVLRQAGLAHILAISGLHMALFAGGTYAAFLMLLSLSETATLRYPTQRVAAVAALFAATCYLGLSGASVATQRSFIMVFLVFLGILTGRRGLTLRSVALAGLILLILAPERLFYPGFQMSFAAVICLVAVYDAWRRERPERLRKERGSNAFMRGLQAIGSWTGGLFLTALIAGTATGLIGMYHFGRIAPFGLIGNMLGMPVFSLLVMPMGVLALVLMPFGLANFPLQIMALGLDLLLRIAEWTASLSGQGGTVPVPDAMTALFATATLFALVLLPGKLRVLSLLPFFAALTMAALHHPPDVQIADQGQLIAARDPVGALRIHAKRTGFAAENWLQVEGVSVDAFTSYKMAVSQFACDGDGCVYRAYPRGGSGFDLAALSPSGATGQNADAGKTEPILLALPKTAKALLLDCRFADVIVTALTVPEDCRAGLVFGGRNRRGLGAISIWLAPPTEGVSRPQRARIARWRAAKTVPPRPWHR